MLNFLQKFGIFCLLDNHSYEFDKSYECIAGAGVIHSIISDDNSSLHDIDVFQKRHQDWIFGHVSYDIKNEIEHLESLNPDGIRFPGFLFFIPKIVFIVTEDKLQIGVYPPHDAREIYDAMILCRPGEIINANAPVLTSRFSRNEYIETVKKLKEHILRGDCYEINFCQEFYADNRFIDPLHVYRKLGVLSPNPFSAFYRYEDKYLMCASPERFLKKTGRTIISQPIKGTAKRISDNPKTDEQEKKDLLKNEKERSENIMIIDLVRNDLAKICTEGSVFVKEFLNIYSFPQVHQMISTITGNLREHVTLDEIFTAAFPMGSMTGAPKKRVMELIDQYEKTKRGLFSGTVGYINPDGNFDFNVVIRSVLYNQADGYVSIQAGSAITFKSNPEKEYEECIMKVAAMKRSLE
ncbi:MAG: anthranilate synthase component I family protein [Ginsengibacter sp.]